MRNRGGGGGGGEREIEKGERDRDRRGREIGIEREIEEIVISSSSLNISPLPPRGRDIGAVERCGAGDLLKINKIAHLILSTRLVDT